jgi:hypothetical protein
MDCIHNVIARTGNCGFSVWSDVARGRFLNNIVYKAGTEEEWICPEVGVWWNGPDSAFVAHHNVIYGSTADSWRRSYWSDDPSAEQTLPTHSVAVPPDSLWTGLYREMDPGFVNAENNNFSLKPDSPLRGVAIETGHPGTMTSSNIGLHDEVLNLFRMLRKHYEADLQPMKSSLD